MVSTVARKSNMTFANKRWFVVASVCLVVAARSAEAARSLLVSVDDEEASMWHSGLISFYGSRIQLTVGPNETRPLGLSARVSGRYQHQLRYASEGDEKAVFTVVDGRGGLRNYRLVAILARVKEGKVRRIDGAFRPCLGSGGEVPNVAAVRPIHPEWSRWTRPDIVPLDEARPPWPAELVANPAVPFLLAEHPATNFEWGEKALSLESFIHFDHVRGRNGGYVADLGIADTAEGLAFIPQDFSTRAGCLGWIISAYRTLLPSLDYRL